ncbi:MAG: PP2C family protein-serine/threonine phosphatase [Candidatus Rifleibacteriota bacterium]
MLKKTDKSQGFAVESLFLFFALLILPAFFFYEAAAFFEKGLVADEKTMASQNLLKIFHSSANFFREELFWQNFLSNSFGQSNNAEEFSEKMKRIAILTGIHPEYVLWNDQGKIETSNLKDPGVLKMPEWQSAYLDIRNILSINPDSDSYRRLRKIFGHEFIINPFSQRWKFIRGILRPVSVDKSKPLVYLAKNDDFMVAVFFPRELIAKKAGFKSFFRFWQKDIDAFATFENGELKEIHGDVLPATAKAAFIKLKNGFFQQTLELDNRDFILAPVNQRKTVLVAGQKYNIPQTGKKYLLLMLFCFFGLALIIKGSGAGAFLPGNFSLVRQIFIMLFIVAGLPALFLAIPAVKYYAQKQSLLMHQKTNELTRYLQIIDRSSSIEISRTINILDRFYRILSLMVAEDYHPGDIKHKAIEVFKGRFFMDYVFVDQKKDLISDSNIFFQGGKARPVVEEKKTFPYNMDEIETLKSLGDLIIGLHNGERSKYELSPEKGYIFEMFFQESPEMFARRLIENFENIFEIGWGNVPLNVYANVLSGKGEKKKSIFMLTNFARESFDNSYLRRNQILFNNNLLFTKFFANQQGDIFPSSLRDHPQIDQLFGYVSPYPTVKPMVIDFEKEKFLIVGIKGRFLESTSLIALYPMNRINLEILAEQRWLLTALTIATLIILALASLFYFSLLRPVSQLQKAAEALEKRDYRFRLGKISEDEFGEMAEIFDETMGDFEELELASMVQTRLLPAEPVALKNYQVFGRSVSMAQMGGDYFDYFISGENHLCALLGDVAGHGVGAALIMAMAKAGIACSPESLADPAALLTGLHRMILKTRSRTQRKIMTFQYLCLDVASAKIVYANAGGCSPLIVNCSRGFVEELSQTAPVLGGFKNSKFSNISLKLEDDQAVVFYSDGFIEARNAENKEMGYEGFKDLVLRNFNDDAKIWNEKTFADFSRWLAGASAQDDLTLVILKKTDSGYFAI